MACLSRYNDRDELYRAVIQEVIDLGNGVTAYGVRYVDYGDYGLVKGNMVSKIQTARHCSVNLCNEAPMDLKLISVLI